MGVLCIFKRKMFDSIVGVCGLLAAIIGLIVARYEMLRRKKLSAWVESQLWAYPGDVAKIHESCHNAWVSSKAALDAVAKLEHSADQLLAVNHIGSTIGDTRAGKDMSINLFGHLLAFQEGQFGTRIVVHAQTSTLTLMRAELESRSRALSQEPVPNNRKRWWKHWKT
jgi:hypothetical protein